MINQNLEKIELFDYIKSKYPEATGTYLNYLLKAISVIIGDSITSTVTKLNKEKHIFLLYYENRWCSNKPWLVRIFFHIKEWYLLRKLTKNK